MNLLLLEPSEVSPDGTARLVGKRLQHAREVLQLTAGDTLRVGVLGGLCGTATVLEKSPSAWTIQVTVTEPPPPRAGVDLLLAIPRPKALKKVLPAIASLGINRLVLLNAARVEKSYFQSKVLEGDFVEALLHAGLEQGRDTVKPELLVKDRFKPFVEDELDAFCGSALRLLPHLGAEAVMPRRKTGERAVLAIGPEGGWVPFEVDLLVSKGFLPVSLGPRPLRVEVAIPALLGALGL